MGSGRLFVCLALLVGCNQVLGLDPPSQRADIDAPEKVGDDASPGDGAPSDGTAAVDSSIDSVLPIDARLIDAPTSSCGSRGTPCAGGGYCNGAGACVACTTNTHCGNPTPQTCTMPVCTAGDTCAIGPAPRDSFCNNWADQCDGLGNCVDCTTSGGCGECCVCNASQVCIPA